jgi:hypothetical protein
VALTNDPALNLRLAAEGVGVTVGREVAVRSYVERGELVPVLEEFSTPFPGFYLYYPQRRQASPALRAHRLPAPHEAKGAAASMRAAYESGLPASMRRVGVHTPPAWPEPGGGSRQGPPARWSRSSLSRCWEKDLQRPVGKPCACLRQSLVLYADQLPCGVSGPRMPAM